MHSYQYIYEADFADDLKTYNEQRTYFQNKVKRYSILGIMWFWIMILLALSWTMIITLSKSNEWYIILGLVFLGISIGISVFLCTCKFIAFLTIIKAIKCELALADHQKALKYYKFYKLAIFDLNALKKFNNFVK
ncbi:hypothetical protein [Mycoplasmopsis opalescens]|uniref:hypothetical protein n=1 Tax=Mycoplasmopsis opalescens TaxID=114886 RepID=UPI0004A6C6EE|nr:hypothetical protein [Mycoplasmopsis opalescens]